MSVASALAGAVGLGVTDGEPVVVIGGGGSGVDVGDTDATAEVECDEDADIDCGGDGDGNDAAHVGSGGTATPGIVTTPR